ncbi:hypothetical protein GIB67_025751, partial [Kingdonia uniflora]
FLAIQYCGTAATILAEMCWECGGEGHEVYLLNRKTFPVLDHTKVIKNNFIEILLINVSCLGACTYSKTKHARGHLGSYTIEIFVEHVKNVTADGVKDIWISSEDTGAYVHDIGIKLLLQQIRLLPQQLKLLLHQAQTSSLLAHTFRITKFRLLLRKATTPFILEHLKEIVEVLCHPCVYLFLHVPVQSGSDYALALMNREYTVGWFKTVVDSLYQLVLEMSIATAIISGFPGKTGEDFS